MDPRLLEHYNRELAHLREMGAEFAREFPKVAGRLGLEGFECADPYVERLLEGFAFLAARVQLKLDDEFPRFTEHLLEIVYPHCLAPTPSMAVVQMRPDLSEGSLAAGFPLPRGTVLKSQLGKGDQTHCDYRTAHDLTLWPLELVEAEYFHRDAPPIDLRGMPDCEAGIRLRLQATAGASFDKLPLDRLPLLLRGAGALPMRLYELLLAHTAAIVVAGVDKQAARKMVLRGAAVQRVGFRDEESLLPFGARSFQGYRLLHEYFAFPARFLFVELSGLQQALRESVGEKLLDVVVLFDAGDAQLENVVTAANFALHATPAVNLFPKRADRIHLSDRSADHQIIPDRTRAYDYEVYAVTEVVGHGSDGREQEFHPFYAAGVDTGFGRESGYFTLRRRPRVLTARERRQGPRSSYAGSEAYISLVDAREAPYAHDLRQLAVATLCTNRDLPLEMPVGKLNTDFSLEVGAPVQSVRCVAGPTRPRSSAFFSKGETAWRLISQLSLNYLSLVDSDARQGAAALRDLLRLYGDIGEPAVRKQIDGLRSISSKPAIRRLPMTGPVSFGRGLEITLRCNEAAFEGSGVFLLGAVLEQFFARYVSINSFTETIIETEERGRVMHWPPRIGRRQIA
jgi:type VI secretion system protein ImpG